MFAYHSLFDFSEEQEIFHSRWLRESMKTSISFILLTVALLCIYPVNSEFSLFLRMQAEKAQVETQPVETAIEAQEPQDVSVSLNKIDILNRILQFIITFSCQRVAVVPRARRVALVMMTMTMIIMATRARMDLRVAVVPRARRVMTLAMIRRR